MTSYFWSEVIWKKTEKKLSKMPPVTASSRILEVRRFACLTNWWASCLNFDNYQPEVASDVISGNVDQDVGMDVCANLGDSCLKPSEASFLALSERR